VLVLPADPFGARIAHALTTQPRLPVLWLNGQDCNGNIEGFLRASDPTPSELVLDRLSIDYVELLMAPSGSAAESRRADTIARYAGRYVLVVEGSVPTAGDGAFCCIGGKAFTQVVEETAGDALAVIGVGSCAFDGGLPAARGGVTGAVGIREFLSGSGKTIITLPGCPMNVDNLAATLVHYLTTVHQVGVADLIGAARLAGMLPTETVLIVIQVAGTEVGIELSPPVERAVPAAVRTVKSWCAEFHRQQVGRR
jgi:hydrogenase small subunit